MGSANSSLQLAFLVGSFPGGTSQSNVSNKTAHQDWVGMCLGVLLRRNYMITAIYMRVSGFTSPI